MPTRLDALDRLRAGAMLAGVAFHAALAHSPMVQPLWLTADRAQAPWLDGLLWPMHLLRMPLFFWLAGFFAAWQWERRGAGGLMRDRVRRVLVPLVVGLPLMHLAMDALVQWGVAHVQHPSPLMGWVRRAWAEGWPSPPPSLGHLWFLAYLLLFTVLLWVGRTLVPLAWRARWSVPSRGAGAFGLLALPVLLVPTLAAVPAPHPAPEALLPQPWAIAFYGTFFALGTVSRPWLTVLARKKCWLGLGLGAGLAMVGFVLLLPRPVPPGDWAVAAVSSVAAVWGCGAVVGAVSAWQAPLGRAMRFLADAAYWVYLVHLPILLALQLATMDLDWPWTVKLPLVLGLTLGLSLGTFALWIRNGVWGRWLLGRRGAAPA